MTFEILRDAKGKVIGQVHNGDPQHPQSWRYLFNDDGKLIGELWGEDKKTSP